MRLPLLLAAVITVAAIPEAFSCFKQHRNLRARCASPVEKKTKVSLAECQKLCLQKPDQCLFAQYEYYRKICEIYNIPSPLEDSTDSELLETFFRTKRDETNGCSPFLQRSLGVLHMQPNLVCLLPQDRTNIRRTEETLPKITVTMPSDNEIPRDPFTDVMILPIVPDCPMGERSKVQVIEGVEVVADAAVTLTLDIAEKCIESCRVSMYPTGNRLPILCRSATYDRKNSKCLLFSDALNPNGYMEYRPANKVIYMEKLCMSESLIPASCDDVFRRIPQHILLGHAAEIVTAASQSECIRECVQAKTRRLECHSVLHYMDVPYQNCILNIHTRTTRPEYFVPEIRYKVDYIEMAPCATTVIAGQLDSEDGLVSVFGPTTDKLRPKLNRIIVSPEKNKIIGQPSVESEWSEWTKCDRSGIRVRDRVCTDCDERVQTEPCLPNDNNEFSKALNEFIKSQEESVHEQSDTVAEKAGFLSAPAETSIIPFPKMNKSEGVQFFGPPNVDLETNNLRRVLL